MHSETHRRQRILRHGECIRLCHNGNAEPPPSHARPAPRTHQRRSRHHVRPGRVGSHQREDVSGVHMVGSEFGRPGARHRPAMSRKSTSLERLPAIPRPSPRMTHHGPPSGSSVHRRRFLPTIVRPASIPHSGTKPSAPHNSIEFLFEDSFACANDETCLMEAGSAARRDRGTARTTEATR